MIDHEQVNRSSPSQVDSWRQRDERRELVRSELQPLHYQRRLRKASASQQHPRPPPDCEQDSRAGGKAINSEEGERKKYVVVHHHYFQEVQKERFV